MGGHFFLRFQGEFNLGKEWFGERKRNRAAHTFWVSVFIFPKHLLCPFLYVTEREGEDETVLKEATVLISSEGSLLFFPPPISFLSPSTSNADLALSAV